MVDGINELSGFPLPVVNGRHQAWSRSDRAEEDSRECPGPISEATLHCPSPRRVLTAGALALVAVAPALDSPDRPTEDANAQPTRAQARTESAALGANVAFQTRA